MAPPPDVLLHLMGDILWNSLTGYYEQPPPSTPERAQERLGNQILACNDLLNSLVDAGDLLDSDVRYGFAHEAYYGYHAPEKNESKPKNTSTSPYKEYALKIVNEQASLDESTYNSLIEKISKDYPNHDADAHTAMAIELAIVAASSAAIRAFYTGIGKPSPNLPSRHSPRKKANFKSVQDYYGGSLFYDRTVSWGPSLPTKHRKLEVAEKFNIDPTLWNFGSRHKGPTSKATAAPLTGIAWMKFMTVMYGASADLPRFLKSLGEDRFLTRGQLEIAAAAYNASVRCRY